MASEAIVVVLGAVLVFWVVGAYNRVVRLRSAVVAAFLPVEARHRERQALLEQQMALVQETLATAGPRLDALRAACRQAETAREHARTHPGATSAITSLRLADEILADARARLPVQSLATPALPALNAELTSVESTLAFARREFNDAVQAYNRAVGQFPTGIVAALFGFRPAGVL